MGVLSQFRVCNTCVDTAISPFSEFCAAIKINNLCVFNTGSQSDPPPGTTYLETHPGTRVFERKISVTRLASW